MKRRTQVYTVTVTQMSEGEIENPIDPYQVVSALHKELNGVHAQANDYCCSVDVDLESSQESECLS